MKEKREHQRVDKKIKSEVHSKDGMTLSTSGDLSKGGIFISTPEPLKVGAEINLVILTPAKDEVEIRGLVRWMNDSGEEERKSGMGIEFIDINETEMARLKKILES